jgi:hypothetical protein
MSTEEQPSSAARGVAAAGSLPRFWAGSPAAWFRTADAFFPLHGNTDNMEKFYMVLCALSETNVDQARSSVEAESTQDSFRLLREALVSTHTLSEYQMVDHIVNMEPLNGRKPTELLAADDKHFFANHFLQRLPREDRVLLSRELVENMQSLVEKADGLMAVHKPQQHDVAAVAVAEEGDEDAAVAAVKKGASGKRAGGKKLSSKPKRQRSHSSSTERRLPLCWLHIRFGDKARRCEQLCAWPKGPGKLKSQGLVAACSPGKSHVSPGRLFFITDNSSGKKLLVDTGSAYSILPYKSRRRPDEPPLRSAGGQRIRCWGSCSRDLLLSGVKCTWSFLLADVSFPILGVEGRYTAVLCRPTPA